MPPTKGGKRPPKGGKSSGKGGKRATSGKGAPHKSGSIGGSTLKAAKKRSTKKRFSWASYIHRTFKLVYKKKRTISSRAMKIMCSLVEDMFDKIQQESVNIAKINKTKTLTAREVQTSARLLLPGELAKHAMSEGTKAVAKYNNTVQEAREGMA